MPQSYWMKSQALPHFGPPSGPLEVDVVVVGGGITGITAALLFKRSGMRVALIERGRCASVDTGHTTAHLTCVTDLRLQDMVKTFGKEQARLVWDAGAAALDQIVALIRGEGIDCDFHWVRGYLHQPREADDPERHEKLLRREAEVAQELGITATFEAETPFFGTPGVRFPHQAIFHPRKYLERLLAAIPGGGSHVFEDSEAENFEDDPLRVTVAGQPIDCRYVVLATHTPLTGISGTVDAMLRQTKLYRYTSYAIAARLPQGVAPAAAFWDTADPYNYLRIEPRPGYDIAIYGGEDHKTGQNADTEACFTRLESRLRTLIPAAEVTDRWSGQVIETNDGLPFIGPTGDRQFAATGFSGNGMTFGTLSAMMAVDAMLGRKNPWQDLFDLHRRKLRGGTWDYLTENKDYPFYMVRDRLARAEGKSLDEVAPGEGKILQLEGRKVAAYRHETGGVTLCSPVCPHLQCIVGWNPAERTWDCPCHGSRFTPTGEVISGPAEEPLQRVAVKDAEGSKG